MQRAFPESSVQVLLTDAAILLPTATVTYLGYQDYIDHRLGIEIAQMEYVPDVGAVLTDVMHVASSGRNLPGSGNLQAE